MSDIHRYTQCTSCYSQTRTTQLDRQYEKILNGTSEQLGYTVPFTLLENTGQKTNQKQTLQKLKTTQKKQSIQLGSVTSYDTLPGNEVGLLYNAVESTRGRKTVTMDRITDKVSQRILYRLHKQVKSSMR